VNKCKLEKYGCFDNNDDRLSSIYTIIDSFTTELLQVGAAPCAKNGEKLGKAMNLFLIFFFSNTRCSG